MLVALCALGLLPSATKANTETRAVSQAVKPVLTCNIVSVLIKLGQATATGGCKAAGSKPVLVVWTHVATVRDATNYTCSVTPASGPGRSFRFAPANASQIAVTFRVRPKAGKARPAVKSATKFNAGSREICSYRPKVVSLDGPTPSALTWATPPSFDGTVLRVGTIQSRGNGMCVWKVNQKLPKHQRGFSFYGLGEVVCSNGYVAGVAVQLNLGLGGDGGWGCYAPFDYITSFAIPKEWGGYAWWQVFLITWIPKGMPDGSNLSIGRESPPAGPYGQWQALPGLVTTKQNPCLLPGMIPAATP